MARNLKNEDNWSKEKYERINARIDKQIGLKLKKQLEEDGKSMASWITENAKKYLKNTWHTDVSIV